MVTIIRCRIVFFLRVQADAVIRFAKGTDQHLGSTVVSKSDTAGEVSFAGISTPTNPAFKLVLNVNRAYSRLRQQYQK